MKFKKLSAPGQEFIAIREFAKREGRDEKQIRRALEKGLLFRNDAGLLDASQVGGGWRKTNRRGREKEARQGADNGADIRKVSAQMSAAKVSAPTKASRRSPSASHWFAASVRTWHRGLTLASLMSENPASPSGNHGWIAPAKYPESGGITGKSGITRSGLSTCPESRE
ncbi:hypothetical protein [Azotobacter beijerinckii]|uniref:hypothetical protein n=1 Tax=Azotobacter beijerinckii TaxID=170623 RepID=UPI00113117B8|nr:hypothetical protein [Azotobacter beijerinckii]